MVDIALAVVEPIVADPDLPAVPKLQAVFSTAGRWKSQRSDLLLALMRTWYADENDLVRLRLERAALTRLTPLLARIVRQGVAEGTVSATWPDHAAAILVAIFNGSSDEIGRLALARRDGLVTIDEVQWTMAAYGEAIERVLGLPAGSFEVADNATLHAFYD